MIGDENAVDRELFPRPVRAVAAVTVASSMCDGWKWFWDAAVVRRNSGFWLGGYGGWVEAL